MTPRSTRSPLVEQTDLLLVAALAVAAAGAVVGGVHDEPLRVALAAPLVLLAPGYALVAVVFPESARPVETGGADAPNVGSLGARLHDRSGLTGVERFALSVAASAALAALVAFVESFVVGVYAAPFALALAGFTVCAAVLAVARRRALPPSLRSGVDPVTRLRLVHARHFAFDPSTGRAGVPFEATSRRDVLVNLVLVGSVVVFLAGVGAAAVIPQGQAYTEFYTVANGSGGNASLVGAAATGPADRTLVVANHEGHAVDYTVVETRQRVVNGTVTGSRVVSTTSRTVAANGTWTRPVALGGVRGGPNVRLRFALYKGNASGSPDLTLRLWYRGNAGRRGDLAPVSA